MSESPTTSFRDLPLSEDVLMAVGDVGYEQPSAIQAQCIPPLLEGRDVLGTAQTGTGKTAAFALPILSKLELDDNSPQVLVLTPTRELAMQVSEAFKTYAKYMEGISVVAIYGGVAMDGQLRQLKRGAQIIVGTPGRTKDHINRKSLKLGRVKTVVLDEADEMLRMGFIDDVEWILSKTASKKQVALFSATMPKPIKAITQTYLNEPVEISIKSKTSTVDTIQQNYWLAKGASKVEALCRLLDVRPIDTANDNSGVIVFVRTKSNTVDIAEKLSARGWIAQAINGDMNQRLREKTIDRIRDGSIDVLVATDVAARGIDVERIGLVVNFDIPYDSETYVHRIGRTGRAGRKGAAYLFVTPRERHLLKQIEKNTGQAISPLQLPSIDDVIKHRESTFIRSVTRHSERTDLGYFKKLSRRLLRETELSEEDLLATLAYMSQVSRPLQPPEPTGKGARKSSARLDAVARDNVDSRPRSGKRKSEVIDQVYTAKEINLNDEQGDVIKMERFRVAVGHDHGVTPGDLVGAVANETGLSSQYIGRIRLFDQESTIDLPADMPDDVFHHLKRVRVKQQALAIERMMDTISGTRKRKDKRTDKRADKPKGNHKSRKTHSENASTGKGKNKKNARKNSRSKPKSLAKKKAPKNSRSGKTRQNSSR